MKDEQVKGYKIFNENWQCTPNGNVFQFEVGKTYTHEGEVQLCSTGFHFCENPLDLFGSYPPTGKFAEVEAQGVSPKTRGDSKRAAKQLTIKAELSLSHIIGIGVKFVLDRVDWGKATATNTGDQSAATNTGDQSAATNTGHRSAATNTGDQSAATNTGKEGCAISLGFEGKAKGALGCWLTLAEWKEGDDGEWHRIDVRTKKVDGKTIKADQFYSLRNGKFKEVA